MAHPRRPHAPGRSQPANAPARGKTGREARQGRGARHVIGLGLEEAAAAHLIDDPATLKVLYDPTRMRILETLDRPRSIAELAAALEVPRGRLYYHVRRLLDHGLIRVADARVVRSNLERLYERAATRFALSERLAESPAAERSKLANIERVIGRYLDGLRAPRPRLRGDHALQHVSSSEWWMRAEDATDLARKLEDLYREYNRRLAEPPGPGGGRGTAGGRIRYGLLSILTPLPDDEGDPPPAPARTRGRGTAARRMGP